MACAISFPFLASLLHRLLCNDFANAHRFTDDWASQSIAKRCTTICGCGVAGFLCLAHDLQDRDLGWVSRFATDPASAECPPNGKLLAKAEARRCESVGEPPSQSQCRGRDWVFFCPTGRGGEKKKNSSTQIYVRDFRVCGSRETECSDDEQLRDIGCAMVAGDYASANERGKKASARRQFYVCIRVATRRNRARHQCEVTTQRSPKRSMLRRGRAWGVSRLFFFFLFCRGLGSGCAFEERVAMCVQRIDEAAL